MLNRIRQQLGTAGLVVAIVALVAALGGGAYAATHSATASKAKPLTKAQVKKIAKEEAKKYANSNPGAPGIPGTPGTNGTNGKDGAPGTNGTDGKDGTSISNTVEAKGANCTEGGTKLVGTSTTYACNGKEGSPWTAGGTLPSGKSETGVWGVGPGHTVAACTALFSCGFEVFYKREPVAAGEFEAVVEGGHAEQTTAFVQASFNIPIGSAPTINVLNLAGAAKKGSAANCPGSVSEPKAVAGNICFYTGVETIPGKLDTAGQELTSKAGAIWQPKEAPLGLSVLGTWAVTAP